MPSLYLSSWMHPKGETVTVVSMIHSGKKLEILFKIQNSHFSNLQYF